MHDTSALVKQIMEAHPRIPAGTTWRHYKGGIYKVNGFIVDTEKGGLLVKYNRIDGPGFDAVKEQYIEYARPIDMWFDDVQKSPGIFLPRFKQVNPVRTWK